MMNEKKLLKEIFQSTEYRCYPNALQANLFNQFTDYAFDEICQQMIDKGVIVAPGPEGRNAIFNTILTLADVAMVFGEITTFRNQTAIGCSDNSTMKSVFKAIQDCGCQFNSNGTVSVDKLAEFRCKVSNMKKETPKW